jgi:hypothetical protein
MLARWIATVAALLLACAQASAHVRSERAADLGTFAAGTEHALEIQRSAANASPGELPTNPKTALPARASLENSASGKNAPVSDCHAWENWSPLRKCASGVDKYLYGNGNPGSYIDPDGRTAELLAAQEKLAAFRNRGVTGFTAAKMGVMEAPWYQKPGMLMLGALDAVQTIIGGGLEGSIATTNLAANTLIVGAGEFGAKESEIFAPAYQQAAGELYGDLDLTFQAVDAFRADPGAATTAALSAPIASLEEAIFENDSAAQIASGQQLTSLPGLIRSMTTRMAAQPKAGVAQQIVEGSDGQSTINFGGPKSNSLEVVYVHRDARGEINYIGITCDPARRACEHRTDPGKTGETMEVVSDYVDHGVARTLEAKLIRERLFEARANGVIDGTEPVEEQLRKAGLLNQNRGREPERWVDDVEPDRKESNQ